MIFSRPTLLLDEQTCRNNIHRIASKFRKLSISLRPHFKTHQSHEVGRWFRDYGVDRITVSSLSMAEYFAADGWRDITVAFPLNPNDQYSINALAGVTTLNLCAVSPGTVSKISSRLDHAIGVFIEVDNGYHRTGVDPADFKTIDTILNEIEQTGKIEFRGFLSHAGHSYKCKSREEVEQVHSSTTRLICDLAARYRPSFPDLKVSVGDTPTCSIAESFDGVDEVRPGNFAFYDLMQTHIGSCNVSDISVALACPVVAKYPERDELVVHGGAVHLSKDFLKDDQGNVQYGRVAFWQGDWWSPEETGMFVKSLSQEHGIIQATPDQQKSIAIGDVVMILPVHSCLTADAMKRYTLRNGTVLQMMA